MHELKDLKAGEEVLREGDVRVAGDIGDGATLSVVGSIWINGNVGKGALIRAVGGEVRIEGSLQSDVRLETHYAMSSTRLALAKLLCLCCLCFCDDCCCRGKKGDIHVGGNVGANVNIKSSDYTKIMGTVESGQVISGKSFSAQAIHRGTTIVVDNGHCHISLIQPGTSILLKSGSVFYDQRPPSDQDPSRISLRHGGEYAGGKLLKLYNAYREPAAVASPKASDAERVKLLAPEAPQSPRANSVFAGQASARSALRKNVNPVAGVAPKPF